MSRIRVFQVIASSDAGGAEENLAALLGGLDRDRFDVSVVCHGHDLLYDDYARHADRIWALDLVHLARPSTIRTLARLFREHHCDLVHTHLWTADTLGGFAARAVGARTVATVTGAYHLPIDLTGIAWLGRSAKSLLYRSTYALFDRVLAVSEYVASDLRDRPGLRVSGRKIAVVHNGIDAARVEQAAASRPPDPSWLAGAPLVSMVANFFPIKGHASLVRALPAVVARFPSLRLVLVGDGPGRAGIERLVGALGLKPHVVFTGRVACGPGVMARTDLVVVPSVSEGLPIVVLEALALGRPVVAADAGGIPEVIGQGEAGWLVPARNAEALAAAMIEALDNRDEAGRRAARGHALVRERFSIDRQVRSVTQAYLDVTETQPSRAR